MCIPFFHKWKTVTSSITEVYESYRDKIPMSRNTRVFYICEKCGIHKTKKFNGALKL